MHICNLSLLNVNHSHWFPERKNRWENGASVFHWPYFNCLRTYVLRKDVGMCLNKALRAMRGEEFSSMWKDYLPALSSCGLFSVHTHPWSLFLFWSCELRASPVWSHLIWITPLKVLSPNTVTLGIRASTQEFLGGHSSVYTTEIFQCLLHSSVCAQWKEYHSHLLYLLNCSSYKTDSILCFGRVFPTCPSLPKQTRTLLCI